MRNLTFALVLAIGAPALAIDDSYAKCLERKKADPRLQCFEAIDVNVKPPTAVQLVMPRSQEAKRDVERTGDHLEEATTRTR